MMLGRRARSIHATFLVTSLLVGALAAAVGAQSADPQGMVAETQGPDTDHPVVGRWNVEAEPGGSVWAFQPSGLLVISGPGEIMSEGAWTPAEGAGAFDASVDVAVTGQSLTVLGQVAEDGSMVALYISATEAVRPDDWTPWPPETRVVAPRFGMEAGESPSPSPAPIECLRPEWSEDGLDWDRCDEGLTDGVAG